MAEEKIKKETEEKAENIQHQKNIEPDQKDQKTAETKNDNPREEQETEMKAEQNEEVSEKESEAEKIEQLEIKLSELSDKHLRLQAEFDNFRRRTLKEKADLIKSGGESVIITLLPIIDDFERALESLKVVPDNDAGKQGTMLIYTKFKDFLKQNNVKEIEALNKDFDVDLHEAVTKIPAPDKKQKGKVVDVIQKGYMLNDKVIRFAKVVIGE
ncbi:MAG: nucleotide exchange factor GrpE [Prolixibacteraceae bacterium]